MYPHASYIIYSTPRSGSYLLCEALNNTRLAGSPTEFLSPEQFLLCLKHSGLHWSDTAGYLDWMYKIGTTPNGVFGIKIIWESFDDCIDHLRDVEGNEKLSVPDLLAKVFPHHQSIMITRRDKVRQAISYWKAIQTRKWVLLDGEVLAPAQEPIFHFESIEHLRRSIIDDEKEMQQYFSSQNIQPLIVTYEDFTNAYEETALQILDYLHIPITERPTFKIRKMKKQSNEQTEEWVKRYYDIYNGYKNVRHEVAYTE